MPYSFPVVSFLISTVPPAWPQATDAGFAIPADAWVIVGVVVPAGVAACWVQPLTSNTSTSMMASPITPAMHFPSLPEEVILVHCESKTALMLLFDFPLFFWQAISMIFQS
jgi:hypothetical protein